MKSVDVDCGLRAERSGWLVGLGLMMLMSSACSSVGEGRDRPASVDEPDGPYVLVLGTAQDGGLPQIGCERECCERAREDSSRRRLVTSLLLVDPRSGKRWLFDASPDLPEQVELARGRPASRAVAAGRPPLFDGIFLTHAHMGHYTGLLHLGREAYGSAGQVVYGTQRMERFLRQNGPWSLLVDDGGVEVEVLKPGVRVRLAEDVEVVPLVVPHRDELSDTVGFLIRGPERTLLYLPDIDKWDAWERRLEDVLGEVDVALVDATFFGPDELPGRDMASIPHPFVVETLARIKGLPAGERGKVFFTHLNHSNPIADPESDAAAEVRGMGCWVAGDGDLHRL